jgi:outer membrane protein assembly factor BamB
VETGQPLWVYEWELYSGRHITDPVVTGKRIYLADNYKDPSLPGSLLLEVKSNTPTVLWKSPDLYTEISNAVIVDGHIYGGQGGPYKYAASLRCVDLETGKLKWERIMSEAMFNGCVSLMAADGKLIILTDDGMLVIAEASAEGYKEISRCEVPKGETGIAKFWTAPVLCNGRIYCRNYYGELVCIDVSK